jgi:hypothetical protein
VPGWPSEAFPLVSLGCARIPTMARSGHAPHQRPDTLMQLSTFVVSQLCLATRGRAIHPGTKRDVFGGAAIPSAIWGAADPLSRAAPPQEFLRARSPPAPPGRGEPQVRLLLGRKLLRVRRPMPGARFFARSVCPPQDGDSSSRCLTCYPRGASRARYDPYEVNLPVVPAGTPSIYAEALSWLIRR